MRHRLILMLLALIAGAAAARTELRDTGTEPPPPGPLPVQVEVAAYVMDLLTIDEKEQTFEAEVLLNFRWRDPRLARPGQEPERLIGGELESRLNQIWSPDLQFVNAVETKTFNQALTLHPDGTVEHRIDLLGRFSTPMDFRRFPFDTQSLNIGIESFMERIDRLKFIPEWGRTRAETDSASGDFMLTGVHPTVTPSAIRGWNENFSHYQLALAVERDVSFYIWRVIVPTSIIVMISFALFFVDISSYHDRVSIAMTCLLACVATQFAISFSLPRIGYLTPIDRFFVWTYIAIAVGVAISTLVKVLEGRGDPRWKILDYHARWVSPLIFFAGIAGVLAF